MHFDDEDQTIEEPYRTELLRIHRLLKEANEEILQTAQSRHHGHPCPPALLIPFRSLVEDWHSEFTTDAVRYHGLDVDDAIDNSWIRLLWWTYQLGRKVERAGMVLTFCNCND